MYERPRRPWTIDGVFLSNIAVSETTTASQASKRLCPSMNGSRFGEPISSSPSIRNLTFTGQAPPVFKYASNALT
jgi:hypothetical protein